MAKTIGVINKIIRFSAVDGPGNRAAIFLQGCNYRCTYCHNPETIARCIHCGMCVEGCPVQALQMKQGKVIWNEAICVGCDACIKTCPHLSSPKITFLTAEQVFETIGSGMYFIRGITVSGGEATLQRDFLIELFQRAHEKKLTALIDSNGSYDFKSDPALLAVTDAVMLDVKAMDENEHRQLTGQGNQAVIRNVSFLAEQKKLYEVRTVIAPNSFHAEETVRAVARMIAPYPDVRYKLIAYRPFGVRKPYDAQIAMPTEDDMQRMQTIAYNEGVRDVVLT